MDEMLLKDKVLLVVDDEADLREIVASELEFMGAQVYQAENIAGAKSIMDQQRIDLIVSDIRMPGGTGVDLLHYIKGKDFLAPPIILITGFADITVEDAFNQGAEALLSKPFRLEELVNVASKLTTSPDRRYKVNLSRPQIKELTYQFNDPLDHKIEDHECAIGRGGMALTVDTNSFKWEIGDFVHFTLKFKDVELTGTAICRWWRPHENSHKATFGLEFVQLTEGTFNYFRDYWNKHSIVPFIPSLPTA